MLRSSTWKLEEHILCLDEQAEEFTDFKQKLGGKDSAGCFRRSAHAKERAREDEPPGSLDQLAGIYGRKFKLRTLGFVCRYFLRHTPSPCGRRHHFEHEV